MKLGSKVLFAFLVAVALVIVVVGVVAAVVVVVVKARSDVRDWVRFRSA